MNAGYTMEMREKNHKPCAKCREVKPLGNFNKNKNSVDGHWHTCRECVRKDYQERRKAYYQKLYQDNKEVMQVQCREWKRKNREKKRQADKEYRTRMTERRNEYNREWWAKNKAHAHKRAKRYLSHKRTYRYKREALLKENGGTHTWQEWVELCERYECRCLRCGEQYPIEGLSADHVIPVTKGGTNDIGNLQPLCKVCNSRKATRAIDYRPIVAVVWPLLRLLG